MSFICYFEPYNHARKVLLSHWTNKEALRLTEGWKLAPRMEQRLKQVYLTQNALCFGQDAPQGLALGAVYIVLQFTQCLGTCNLISSSQIPSNIDLIISIMKTKLRLRRAEITFPRPRFGLWRKTRYFDSMSGFSWWTWKSVSICYAAIPTSSALALGSTTEKHHYSQTGQGREEKLGY